MAGRSTASAPGRGVVALASSIMAFAACSDDGTDPASVSAAPARLEAISATILQGTAGEPLPSPLTLRVLDDDGGTVAGVVVQFETVTGGGQTAPERAVTDEAGVARSVWTLGRSLGDQRLVATAPGTPAPPLEFVAAATPGPLLSVAISPIELTLPVGESHQFTAEGRDAYGLSVPAPSTTWSTSDPAVATVSEAGLVTAVSPGTSRVMAEMEGISGVASLTVGAGAPASLELSPREPPRLAVGEQVQLTALVRDGSGHPVVDAPVTWSSSKPHRFDVSGSGKVTSRSEVGAAWVRAAVMPDGPRDSVRVVSTGAPATSIEAISDTFGLSIGGSADIYVEAYAEDLGFLIDRITDVHVEDRSVVSSVVPCNDSGWCWRVSAGAPGWTRIHFGADSLTRTIAVKVTTPSRIEILTGNDRTVRPGRLVQMSHPTVRVIDSEGVGVAGIPITLSIVAGGGRAEGGRLYSHPHPPTGLFSQRFTNERGLFLFQWWMGDLPGENSVSVSAPGLSSATFRATAGSVESDFDIDVRFVDPVPDAVAAVFADAVQRFREIIRSALLEKVVDLTPRGDFCDAGSPGETVRTTKVVVFVKFESGLNRGRVCSLRDDGLPALSTIQIHSGMLTRPDPESFQHVIMHELGHALGIGSIANWFRFVDYGSLTFTGPTARAAFTDEIGALYDGPAVPLENGSHWDIDVVAPEMMTHGASGPFASGFSRWTAGALKDMGYDVDISAADAWTARFFVPPMYRAGRNH